jgi:hypothetical protein
MQQKRKNSLELLKSALISRIAQEEFKKAENLARMIQFTEAAIAKGGR